MKIIVEGIPSAGRQVSFDRASDWAVEAAALSLDRPPEVLEGQFQLKRAKNGVVIVDLRATAQAPATCDRCGEECQLAIALDTRLLYAPEESGGADYDGLSLENRKTARAEPGYTESVRVDADAAEDEAIELHEDDLDVGWYQNGEIALADVLSEALALATPPRIVCADVAECDKRTSALLSVTSVADSGPFAALGALKRPVGEG